MLSAFRRSCGFHAPDGPSLINTTYTPHRYNAYKITVQQAHGRRFGKRAQHVPYSRTLKMAPARGYFLEWAIYLNVYKSTTRHAILHSPAHSSSWPRQPNKAHAIRGKLGRWHLPEYFFFCFVIIFCFHFHSVAAILCPAPPHKHEISYFGRIP